MVFLGLNKKNRNVVSIGNPLILNSQNQRASIKYLGFHLATWALETFGDVIGHFIRYQNFYIGMTIGTFIQVKLIIKHFL